MTETILLTGGTGYIGSHAAVYLIEAWYRVVAMDDLSNSSDSSLDAVEAITGTRPVFYRGDIRDPDLLRHIFESEPVSAVAHFAGRKSIGESVKDPFLYYDHNISGSVALFAAMERAGCRRLVFSGSATVYRPGSGGLILEGDPLGTSNPYGTTKLVIERLIEDFCRHRDWHAVSLRYFNPIGAHPSGLLGERPVGTPNNLLPYLLDVAAGRRDRAMVYGDGYPTPDGTGVRDYVHVDDLAEAHVAAIGRTGDGRGAFEVYNIGTGHGTSVLEMIGMVERASGRSVPYEVVSPRAGDLARVLCDPSLAERELGWRARRSPQEAVDDAWRFASRG